MQRTKLRSHFLYDVHKHKAQGADKVVSFAVLWDVTQRRVAA